MPELHLTIDRFEGESRQIAVLVTDDEQTLQLPRSGLPTGAREGDVLRLTLEVDPTATAALRAAGQAVQDELRATDPGGDLRI